MLEHNRTRIFMFCFSNLTPAPPPMLGRSNGIILSLFCFIGSPQASPRWRSTRSRCFPGGAGASRFFRQSGDYRELKISNL